MIELIPTKELKKIAGGVAGNCHQGGPPHTRK